MDSYHQHVSMEDMDAAAVASWLRGLGLEAAAVAAEREGVDGYLLVALAADDAGLQDGLGVTATLDAAKIRAGLARLANKRPAAGAAGAADPKRQRVSLPASPLLPPGAAAASLAPIVSADITLAGETSHASASRKFPAATTTKTPVRLVNWTTARSMASDL